MTLKLRVFVDENWNPVLSHCVKMASELSQKGFIGS
jgi:hypothetical protein